MKRRQKATWFLSGVLAAVLAVNLLSPALAALSARNIEVHTGVNVYMDDRKLNPTDGNGNAVPVFIYNGTTYLPVRAISEALNTPIQWDGSTSSVYIGKHTGTKPAVWLSDLDYFTRNGYYGREIDDKDNVGNTYQNAYTLSNVDVTYVLNGQYSHMTGTFYQRYKYRNLWSSTMEVYADGELVYNASMEPGIMPVEFDIDLTGVLQLRIKVKGGDGYQEYAALGNCGLWA